MSYSVVIPAYNASETLVETLDSVFAQTIPPGEVLLINDGSNDRTLEIATAYSKSLVIVSQTNQGCGKATSVGIQLAKYPIIATVDADDIWLPHKMKRQLAHLQANQEISILCSQLRLFHHNNHNRDGGSVKDGYGRSTLVIRRTVYDLIGEIIDPPGNRGDLVDWLARCREHGLTIGLLPEILCLRRIIPGSLSYGRNKELDLGYLDVARRAILRKKLNQGKDIL